MGVQYYIYIYSMIRRNITQARDVSYPIGEWDAHSKSCLVRVSGPKTNAKTHYSRRRGITHLQLTRILLLLLYIAAYEGIRRRRR